MKKNSKDSVALHCLIHLIKSDGPQTSEDLALCSQTNPVVVRRILGELRKSGIVSSEKGHGGGWSLSSDPKKVSLLDVYQALGESLLPDPPDLLKDEKCMILKTLAKTMDEFLIDAHALLNTRLNRIKLEDIAKQIDHLPR